MAESTDPSTSDEPDRPARKRGRGADPEQTRADLVQAAFESLRDDGIAATTARSIAARAGCNQAAIYYHFGGIEPLLIAALDRSSRARLDRYRAELGTTTDLGELVAAIERLYVEDRASGHMAVLAEMAGGIASNPELREGIELATQPWVDFVEERIRLTAADLPLGQLVPAEDVADLIFSIVIGFELRNRVDGRTDRGERLFRLAGLAAAALGQSLPTKPTP